MRFRKKNKYKKRKYSRRIFLCIFLFLCITSSLLYYIQFISKCSNSSGNYEKIIRKKAKKYYLDSNLVKAVIWRESSFNVNAAGSKGEIGLMQIIKKSAVKDWENYYKINLNSKGILFNPNLNIEIGCWYLAKCRRHWFNYKEPEILMLAEYNAGYANVKKWTKDFSYNSSNTIDIIGFKSTRKYIDSIMKQYKKYSIEKNNYE